MKKIQILVAAVVAVLALMLTACQPQEVNSPVGGGAEVELDEIRASIVEHIAAILREQGYTDEDFEWSELPGLDILDELTGDDFGIETGVDVGFAIRAGMGLSPDDIAVIRIAGGKADEIKAMIEEANQEKYDFFADYNPAGAAKIQNAIVRVYGDFVVNIIFDGAEAIDAVIAELFS